MDQYKKEITNLFEKMTKDDQVELHGRIARGCLLYTSPSPRDVEESRMPSSA